MPTGEHDKFGTPYRPPCFGWPALRYILGPMFNHYRHGEATVPKYSNTTAVPNPICEDDWDPSFTPPTWPASVSPYTRPHTSQPGRTGYPTDSDYCDPGHAHGLPYGPWLKSQLEGLCGSEVDFNCYDAVEGETVDLSVCRKLGFKNVQARHFWHGRFGFESLDGPTDCGVAAEDTPSTPDSQKYLTVRVYAKSAQTNEGEPDSNYSYEFDRTFTVDRITGITTQSGPGWTISTTHGNTDPPDGSFVADVFAKAMGFGALFCAPNYDDTYIYGPLETHPTETQTILETSTFDRSDTEITHTLTYVGTGESPSDNSVQTHIESATLSNPSTAIDLVAVVRGLLAEWDLGDDSLYPWRMDSYTTVAPLVEYDSVHGVVSPIVGSPNGSINIGEDDWTDPNADLFDGSIIGSPVPYPGAIKITQDSGITTDFFAPSIGTDYSITGIIAGTELNLTYKHVAILAAELRDGDGVLLATGVEGTDFSYDELFGVVTILTDSNLIIDNTLSLNQVWINYTYDEERAGHFDYRHETWHWDDPGLGGTGPFLYGYGAWSAGGLALDATDYYMPRCATHWTQNNDAQGLPHGAYQRFEANSQRLVMQKWAEIKIPRPSQNFFGPCGAQRYEIDASKSSCVQSVAGDPPLVTVATGEGSRFTVGNKVIYWTGEDPGDATAALYAVTGVSTDDVQLSAKVCDVSATFAGGPMLGVLKFPDAWAICGRAGFGIVDNLDGTFTVTLTDAGYLRVGDLLDFTSYSGTTETVDYSAVPVVSVTSSTVFKVNRADFSGLAALALPTSTHLKSSGAPAYWWNDTNPKGDFLFFEWVLNDRDYTVDDSIRSHQASHGMPRNVATFTVTESCVEFTPCCPSVLCISPNFDEDDEESIDQFNNGSTFGFGDFTPDGRFGSAWQAVVRQTMDDILWHLPLTPCSIDGDEFGDYSGCTLTEDLSDGLGVCLADTCLGVGAGGKFYYPYHRVVEARKSVPAAWNGGDTAPTLYAGLFINYLSLADLDTAGTPPDGNILTPPQDVGGTTDRLYQPNPVGYQDAPWALYADMQTCVCAAGRFASDYLSDWVICGLLPV